MTREDKFLSLLEANRGILYKVANSYYSGAEDRKDLVQEIVVQLWRSFENYNDEYRYSTWMYRIALNVAISFRRKEKSRQKLLSPVDDELLHFAAQAAVPEMDERIGVLNQFIYELKELDKALMLLYLEEKSYREIADILGLTESNVGTKIGRIKNLLKQRFEHSKL